MLDASIIPTISAPSISPEAEASSHAPAIVPPARPATAMGALATALALPPAGMTGREGAPTGRPDPARSARPAQPTTSRHQGTGSVQRPARAGCEAVAPAADLLPDPVALSRAWLAHHGQGLAVAAELLGGRRWFGRYLRIVGDLARGRLTRGQVRREMDAFRDLLDLEHVGDPAREEGGCFALLDPDGDEADQIRLLAEALQAHLVAFDAAAAAQDKARALAGPFAPRTLVVEHRGPGRIAETRQVGPSARSWPDPETAREAGRRGAEAEAALEGASGSWLDDLDGWAEDEPDASDWAA